MTFIDLDIKTLSVVFVIYAFIFSLGLFLLQSVQKKVSGLSWFSLSILVIGLGSVMLSVKGEVPDFIGIIMSNLTIAYGFHLILYSLVTFRGYTYRVLHYNRMILLAVFIGFLYFTYYEPSLKNRVIVISLYLAVVTAFSVLVIVKGKLDDLSLALNMLALSFAGYSLFMFYRAAYVYTAPNALNGFNQNHYINDYAYVFSITLIVSVSFSMLWLINARLVNSLRSLSQQDPLTRLQNRRALDKAVKYFQERKEYRFVGLVLLDIDNFKQVNDQFGHLTGDKVIKQLAITIKSVISAPTCAYRLGGDEILILLPNSTLNQAVLISEKIRLAITQIRIEREPSLRITSSFGVSLLTEHEKWEDCINRADKALYQAKLQGRNSIVVKDGKKYGQDKEEASSHFKYDTIE
ncbi:GGDEF domain-containing protein [Vibrio cyclitrophicus]|uniref:GGDEF domain-containing protein n=1 Tax=Vibrio cyclitrophicus TaxID=47951 RepID=UPI0021C45FDC|nr:GGDEF domain-containing protein [Vibrio cyclitrophicus]